MITPFVHETPIEHGAGKRHGENAEQHDRGPREPRHRPYHRASQRELVRRSLDMHLHTNGYDREDHR